STAERVGQQLPGNGADELFLLSYEGIPQGRRSFHFGAVEQHAGCVDRPAGVGAAPLPDGVEILETESQWVHARVTACADSIPAMHLQHLTDGERLGLVIARFQGGNIGW